MDEKRKQIYDAIGAIQYLKISEAIRKTLLTTPPQIIYNVTNNKRVLQNKKLIETLFPNVKIMTEQEWLVFAFSKLKPEDQKKVSEKIRKQIIG
jgi:hypothetical protein